MTPVALPAALLAALLFFGAAWLAVSLPGLVALTGAALEWCRGAYTVCLAYSSLAGLVAFWTGAFLFASGLARGVLRSAGRLTKARRAVAGLPLLDTGSSVVLIRDTSVKTAFTHGFIRPRVFISTGLIHALSRDELFSAVLHEAHHRRRRDPLRFFMAAFIKDAFFYLPVAGWLAGRVQGGAEREADDSVVEKTADPLTLAGAIVKAARSGVAPVAASLAGGGGRGTVRERVIRLVEGRETGPRGPGAANVAVSIAVAFVLSMSLLLPVRAELLPRSCSAEVCSTHVHSGPDCEAHCEARNGGHGK